MQYIILPKSHSYSPVFSVKPTPVYSLYQTLHRISDPRRAQGRRHPLPIVLTIAILAMCTGDDNYQAMKEWAYNYQSHLQNTVPFLARHVPDPSTFHRIFAKIDLSMLEAVLAEWIQEIVPMEDEEGIAIDGKAVRGSGYHLVAAFAHKAQAVLFQEGITEKGKELIAAPKVLNQIPLKGHIVTGDALFTQKNLCKKITKEGGGFVFTVKDNQKTLHEDITLFFKEPPLHTVINQHITVTHHKGRVEKRTMYATEELKNYLEDWPEVTHTWKVVREREEKGKNTKEVAYGIARLLMPENPAQQLNRLLRGHWSIENRLHRQRDVVFNEDSSTIRTGSAPQVMAALRNIVTTIFHRGCVRSFKTAQRRFSAHPQELFEFLGLPSYVKAYAV